MQVFAQQNDNLDAILYRHFGSSNGLLEQTLILNPQLTADAILPLGAPVRLPEQTRAKTVKHTVQLWE